MSLWILMSALCVIPGSSSSLLLLKLPPWRPVGAPAGQPVGPQLPLPSQTAIWFSSGRTCSQSSRPFLLRPGTDLSSKGA